MNDEELAKQFKSKHPIQWILIELIGAILHLSLFLAVVFFLFFCATFMLVIFK